MEPLNDQVIDRIVEMAWEDRTSFDGIFRQFGVYGIYITILLKFGKKI